LALTNFNSGVHCLPAVYLLRN